MHGEGAFPWRELLWFVGWVAALWCCCSSDSVAAADPLPALQRARYNGAIVLGALRCGAGQYRPRAPRGSSRPDPRATFTPSRRRTPSRARSRGTSNSHTFYHAAARTAVGPSRSLRFSGAATRGFTCAPSIPTSSRSWPRRTAFACTCRHPGGRRPPRPGEAPTRTTSRLASSGSFASAHHRLLPGRAR